jgi:hypothetical protein
MGGDSYLDGKKILNLRCGEDFSVEEEANRWLARSREGITALSEKRDWLSYDQLQLRRSREVFNRNGIADEELVSGLFRRAYNPMANSRPSRRGHQDE